MKFDFKKINATTVAFGLLAILITLQILGLIFGGNHSTTLPPTTWPEVADHAVFVSAGVGLLWLLRTTKKT